MKNSENDNLKNIEFIYHLVKDRLESEFNAIDIKNQKTGTIIGFNSVVLSITLSYYSNVNLSYLYYVGIILLFLSIIKSFLAYRVTGYRRDPEPKPLWEGYHGKDYKETLEQIITNLVESFNETREKSKRKDMLINLSLIFSISGLLFIFCSIIIN